MDEQPIPVQQVPSLQRSLFSASRLAAFAIVGTIIWSLTWITLNRSNDSCEELAGGLLLTDYELERVEMAFGNAGLSDYQRIGRKIKIPKENKSEYLKALVLAQAIPGDGPIEQKSESCWELEVEHDVWRSATRERAREKALEKLLVRLPQIESINVDYDEYRLCKEYFRTASIQLKTIDGKAVDDATKDAIVSHTSSYFSGLTPNSINLIDTPSITR